ncbi:expressed unknown protein [Seminavis robusta]|uniref:Uncharacterized protein n=1 Tax=Seminavis robusta TaxID=568900 RepID=A0A9N8E1S4_9STRA|nr:expressed unknown protein [Seminavis robusta]|eukprot:Sro564_g167470.1 n/a (443) ;mRNA; f:48711-50132
MSTSEEEKDKDEPMDGEEEASNKTKSAPAASVERSSKKRKLSEDDDASSRKRKLKMEQVKLQRQKLQLRKEKMQLLEEEVRVKEMELQLGLEEEGSEGTDQGKDDRIDLTKGPDRDTLEDGPNDNSELDEISIHTTPAAYSNTPKAGNAARRKPAQNHHEGKALNEGFMEQALSKLNDLQHQIEEETKKREASIGSLREFIQVEFIKMNASMTTALALKTAQPPAPAPLQPENPQTFFNTAMMAMLQQAAAKNSDNTSTVARADNHSDAEEDTTKPVAKAKASNKPPRKYPTRPIPTGPHISNRTKAAVTAAAPVATFPPRYEVDVDANDDRPREFAVAPTCVAEIWEEWMYGLNGNVPVKDWTLRDRIKGKNGWWRRRPLYFLLDALVGDGRSPEDAIKDIEKHYGPSKGISPICDRIRADVKNGCLPVHLKPSEKRMFSL